MRLLAGGAAAALCILSPAPISLAAPAPTPVDVAAIRAEGLENGQATLIVQELADGIGPRLTGSPNMDRAYRWAIDKAARLGLEKVRLEPIGIEATPWVLKNVSVTMTAPDSMVFVAQAGAWSVATNGPLEAAAIPVEIAGTADFARYRGKLAGKIILLGPLRQVPLPEQPLAVRYSDAEILAGTPNKALAAIYDEADTRRLRQIAEGRFKGELRAFFEAEKVAAVIVPSREGARGGGSGNLSVDEGPFSVRSWDKRERAAFPFVYVSIEHFGRAWRLAETGASPRIRLDIDTEEGAVPSPAYNVIAEIPGTDPKLASQIVLAAAHLDSWAAGTGALDNASGVAAVLEAARILKATGFRPRRTIRVVLFGAEEQGLHGSYAYAGRHLGRYPRDASAEAAVISAEGRRTKTGSLNKRPGYKDFSIMFNMDGGTGRVRGVFAGRNPALAAQFREWIEPLKDLGVLAVYEEFFYPADQSSFTDIGLPGVMFQQDPLEYFTRARHSNLDTFERIVPEDLAQQATVLAVFIARSAAADALMPRAQPHP